MTRREKLFAWVRDQHHGQLIKKTTEPYINHLKAVAEMAGIVPSGYEAGLCHDLFEETNIDAEQLLTALKEFGYNNEEANTITNCISELTDVYTKKAYPDWSKTTRKKYEAERLATISPTAQTIKYADLIYNIGWMLKYDLKHAKKYLRKKRTLLLTLTKGDATLHEKAMKMIEEGLCG